MDKITHEMRLMQWSQIIHECRNSGIGVRSWCLENNINEKKFYYWQRRVRGKVFDTLKKMNLKTRQTLHNFQFIMILQKIFLPLNQILLFISEITY